LPTFWETATSSELFLLASFTFGEDSRMMLAVLFVLLDSLIALFYASRR
jgi:hypothetical protein